MGCLTLGSLGDYHSTSGTESTEGRFREVGLPPLPLHPRSDDLVGVVREAMQPTHVSMWLRADTTYEGSRQSSGRSIHELLKEGEFSADSGTEFLGRCGHLHC
jgi:hypothetical protein